MRIIKAALLLVVAFVFSSTSFAQTFTGILGWPDYFPPEVGNIWMYRLVSNRIQTETAFRTVSVDAKETLNTREYFRVLYFGRTVYLRSTEDGEIVSLNRGSGDEEPFLSLGTAEGKTFEAHIDQCTNTGKVVSRSAEVTTPAGGFQNALQITFQGNCADAGTTQEFYAAGTGLVSHEETSFAGPRLYQLVYFRAGSANGAAQEVSFTIGLDAPRYPVGSSMAVRLTLRSTHPDPVTLHFPSGQSFDLKIFNEKGDSVYTWSADKFFTLIIRDETFGPGERTYGFPVPLGNLPAGRYRAQGFLTTSPRMYLGETTFEIQ